MSQVRLPNAGVGNDFILPKGKIAGPAPATVGVPLVVVTAPSVLEDVIVDFEKPRASTFHSFMEFIHGHSWQVFTIMLLIIGMSAIKVGGAYWSASITLAKTTASTSVRAPVQPLQGPNTTIRSDNLAKTLESVSHQPINVSINGKAIAVSPDVIKSWMKVVTKEAKNISYIHVSQSAVQKSLSELAAPYVKAPLNQVNITRADGTIATIASGKNGLQLGDITPVTKQITQGLLSGKGLQAELPIITQNFGVSAASEFDKLIEVNVVTKQMYLYEKGQLVKQYPISAGAPETPTPIGQYKIYSKLTVQDMRGFNANGTRYFQPHVRWINYFLPGGYAIHGNYWRPASWFGVRNSSHGCVSLPDYQAKEVYDWAPIGTTIITHT